MEVNQVVQTVNVLTERAGKAAARYELEIAELWTEIFKLREKVAELETKNTKKQNDNAYNIMYNRKRRRSLHNPSKTTTISQKDGDSTMFKWFKQTPEQKRTRVIYREWDKQRREAEPFGGSHTAEIDAIFSRALAEMK